MHLAAQARVFTLALSLQNRMEGEVIQSLLKPEFLREFAEKEDDAPVPEPAILQHVTYIMGMGFSRTQSLEALTRAQGALDRAVNCIFDIPGYLSSADVEAKWATFLQRQGLRTQIDKYEKYKARHAQAKAVTRPKDS